MRARLTSTHFVGRSAELAELERALSEAVAAQPTLVLLGGQSGVGKTRLISELAQRAGERALLLRGEAVEHGGGELPYAPLIGALRPLVRERDPVLQALSAGSLRQLAAILPGLEQSGPPDDQHDGSGQLRLFEALLELLDVLGERGPVALILEDLHWADRSTRMFVAFLARSLRQERLALIVTYRTDELHRRHALTPLLAELERLERTRRVELAPFDRDELTEALTDILGEEPSPRLVERLYARSEGNPLYSEELLAAGLDGRGAPPQSLRDAFMLRIERLPQDAQRAARAIAAGRALDESTIAEVTGIEHETLHEALREAVAEHVLLAGSDDRFCFRHALLREAVYDDLLPGERGELHLALAAVLESRAASADGDSAELAATIAGHYLSAGDQPAALRATVDAVRAARASHAYGDAADMAERALELWPRVAGAGEMLPLDHVELLSLAADAHVIAGDRARADVLLQSALEKVDPAGEPSRYASLLRRLARIQWALNRGTEALETAQRALAMLPRDEVSAERASLLGWLARVRFLRGHFREALEEGEQALSAAGAARDLRVEGEVLNTLGMTRIVLGQLDAGVADLRRAIELNRALEDVDHFAYSYANLADMLNIVGRSREALQTALEGLEGTPSRFSLHHDWLKLTASELAFELGDWKTARAHLAPRPAHPVGRSLIARLLREGELALGVGDEETACRNLEEAEPLVESSTEPQWIGALGALLAELRRRQFDLPAARAVVEHALDRMELCTDDVMRIARVAAAGARVEADIAQRARDLRDRAAERDALARVRLHMQRLDAAAQAGGPVEAAWRVSGAAEFARARGRDDPKLWLVAAARWDAIERPYQAAVSRWRAAEAYAERGDRAPAAEMAAQAHLTAEQLGSRWLGGEVTALAERARLQLVAGDGERLRGDSAPAAAGDPFGLTPRERQVLALIAEGATNRQIGSALFMAEKTASVHVSRILTKLGVSSRTQAAAVAHRMHLDRVA